MELWQILTLIFGVLSAFLGVYWQQAKTVIAEVGVLFNVISESLSDDELTKEELELIVIQIKKVLSSFKKRTIVAATENLQFMRDKKIAAKKPN